ncbi:MAG: 16S rRNA (cytosine(1402)-N(4))-methyltransferase RsmH [Parcubacteria group bacterium]|nr:16S rRNA (cytosine(1402)-N(4))-methyltransferase RsmH [Parcubacteria group bacterium]
MVHVPVLFKEVIEILDPKPGEFFIDGTLGGGGHAVKIIERILPDGTFLGIDWDRDAIEHAKLNVKNQRSKVILVHGNYADLPEILKREKLPRANGLILDLGFSSEQLAGKGFSFLKDEPLTMRYDSSETGVTAADVVNGLSEKELADVIYKFGEERFSRKIAKAIVERRRKKRIETSGDLANVVGEALPKNYERGRIHPATRTFQAIRIYLNDELGNLERLLDGLGKILKPRGRAAIISFHSLEDRLVKNYFKKMKKEGKIEILTKKPALPSPEEIRANPRSRSAKLRAAIIL